MVRMFNTHEIRRQFELGGLWNFTPLGGKHKKKSYAVAVPSCWEIYPEFSSYCGKAVYSTAFEAGGNLRLVFKGVSHTARVFLDARLVAEHYNAYTPFEAVVRNLPEGLHRLEVEVDNSFSEASALHIPNDYKTYGGISRPVVAQLVPDAYIQYVHFTPFFKNGAWHASITAQAENLSEEDREVFISSRLDGRCVELGRLKLGPAQSARITREIRFDNVEPYSQEKPVLYLLKTQLSCGGRAVDDLIERVGFREITIEGKKLLVNGRAVFLKGFCRHEDHPMFGCALPYQVMDHDLNLMLDMGANAVRTAHYPNDELFLDMCDEKGVLVWEEGHARGLSEEDMRNPSFDRQSEDCIREMIINHYNHPSIFIWGILNECASETEYGRECYAKQFAQIKSLDSSRPASFASCKFMNDISLGLPEVVSYNIYPLWYHNTPPAEYLRELYDWVQNSTEGAGKPFLITEIGAGAIYGYRSPSNVKWTEERQADILREQISAVLSHEDVTGIFIWQFCDIRVSEEWFGTRPRTMNNKGIVDEYRRRKLSYEVVKKLYT